MSVRSALLVGALLVTTAVVVGLPATASAVERGWQAAGASGSAVSPLSPRRPHAISPSVARLLGGGGARDEAQRPLPLPEFDRAAVQQASSSHEHQEVPPAEEGLSPRQRSILRRVGWSIPPKLTGGWTLRSAHIAEAGDENGGLLQLVYTRSGTTLSVFQRAAGVDWSSLPPGSESVGELSGAVREWPDADPPRVVWQADGRTFAAVGADERNDLIAAVADLPPAEDDAEEVDSGLLQRVLDGIGRLRERMSP